jgi:hypothetical protein
MTAEGTATQYGSMLRNFEKYLSEKYSGLTADQLINDLLG